MSRVFFIAQQLVIKTLKRLIEYVNIFFTLLVCFLTIFNPSIVSAQSQAVELEECVVITHCVRSNWEVDDVGTSFKKVLDLIRSSPRTNIVQETNSYIHAEAETKWMHYIDDLEVQAIPEKGIIQVRSESRIGIGDNGVNQKRINDLEHRMFLKNS
tara:strand:+ start:408 stop:875 length:468 start_codon:yes stop_codon:yes gene_type:complete